LVLVFCGLLSRHYTKRVEAEQREAALKLEAQKLEHLAEIGMMASGLNHELGNILTPFKLEVGNLATKDFGDADFMESVGILTGYSRDDELLNKACGKRPANCNRPSSSIASWSANQSPSFVGDSIKHHESFPIQTLLERVRQPRCNG